jgi:hypothetical protein
MLQRSSINYCGIGHCNSENPQKEEQEKKRHTTSHSAALHAVTNDSDNNTSITREDEALSSPSK